MNQLEENIVRSFRLCKSDIIKMQNNDTEMGQTQERLMEIVDELRKKVAVLSDKTKRQPAKTKVVRQVVVKRVPGKTRTVVKKVVSQRAKTFFIASKTGMKLHDRHCPFAKNIHPKSKVIFHSKDSALNKGLTLCECLKK